VFPVPYALFPDLRLKNIRSMKFSQEIQGLGIREQGTQSISSQSFAMNRRVALLNSASGSVDLILFA